MFDSREGSRRAVSWSEVGDGKLGMAEVPFTVLQGGVPPLADQIRAISPLANDDEANREPIYGVISQGKLSLRRILDWKRK
ncbi:hypothetical protein EI981_07585 [Paenibacillus lutimineralis]|uniref:Uncharacterized protein n=1 Tax=Paenibacillus lutimineralis TaxID=2707005 RepID=A0A3S9UVI0_9BACL|nr:hypothetical protein EI981_07585 [Paenibacillus lutimineralis]